MAAFVLLLFCSALLVCVVLQLPVVYALAVGLALFSFYAYYQKYSVKAIGRMLYEGAMKARIILTVFVLIGMLTATWRACGTIPYIVYYSIELVSPRFFILSGFLVSCVMSLLTGTCFGTVGTIGTICMIIARANGVDPVITAGAVISGGFFGDRISPMSSSALLVSQLSGSDIYVNIRNMARTTILPLALTLLAYGLLSGRQQAAGDVTAVTRQLPQLFQMSWPLLVPAAIILVLCLLRVRVLWTMLCSVVAAFILCVLVQGVPLARMPALLLEGYLAEPDSGIGAIMNGGGILSMLNALLVVLISSSYSRIFEETGLLESLQALVNRMAQKTRRYTTVMTTSLITSVFSCSQSFTIILTHQLCGKIYDNSAELALDLEDSASTIPALIPWSVASAVPLATMGVDIRAIPYALFIYLLPLSRLLTQAVKKYRSGRHKVSL